MRIVAVNWRDLAHPSAGGAEVVIDRLLDGLCHRGHDVTLVCGGPVAQHNYEVVDAGGTYSQYVRAPWVSMTRFKHADLVIDVENGMPYFSPLWRRGPSICLVHHVHTDQWETRFPPSIAAVARAVETRLVPAVYRHRLFVAISSSTAQALGEIGVDADRIRVIEPGVDLPPQKRHSEAVEPLFVALTRLVPHKQIELLLDAWRIVHPVTGGRFLVMGSGPELSALERRAAGLTGVEFLGRVSDDEKWRLLGEAWFLVHGAHHEGWGMNVMEAGAMGTPSLVVNAPGVRDSVVDGVTGVVVDASDRDLPTALAETWVELSADTARRKALGAAARSRATTHGWDKFVDSWIEVAREAIDFDTVTRKRHTKGLRQPPAPVARGSASPVDSGIDRSDGVRRMLRLLNGFRHQFDDPDQFYTLLADDTIALIERFRPVAGQRVLDVGGGSGYFAEAFRRSSAESAFIEPEWDEMTEIGRKLGFGIVGDGCQLPLADASFDISFSSNVIEHVKDPTQFLEELVRVVKPGGLIFVAFTNWLSPFGGHETSPWHYLGGERAARRYQDTLGYPPKNRYGESLFPLSISTVLKWGRKEANVEVLDAFPRYYPHWSKSILRVPGVREVVTWNLAMVLRRVAY